MRCSLAAVLVGLALCGCSDSPRNAPVAAAPVYPQLPLRSVTNALESSQGGQVPARSTWEIQIAQFHDHQVAPLGLTPLYSNLLQTNEASRAALGTHPLLGLADSHTNVSLTTREGTHIAISSMETADNLLAKLKKTAGVDLLTTPLARLQGTNPAQVSVQGITTVVLPTQGARFVQTTNLSFGLVLDLQLRSSDGDDAMVHVVNRFDQFRGYGGNPTNALIDVGVLGASVSLSSSEVLLLGSTVDRSVQQFSERVPYLSDIPGLGPLFIKSGWQTNLYRYLLILRRKTE